MYAVIETGGKQYRVEKGTLIRVEKLDVPEGDKIVFERVLLASNEGRIYAGPEAEKVKVEGTIVRQGKAKKIVVFKYKPKKGYHRKSGHRQLFTEIRVDKITGGPRAARAKKTKKEVEEVEAVAEEKVIVKEASEDKGQTQGEEKVVLQVEAKEDTQAKEEEKEKEDEKE
jgi:large subunit ribosomal protein L21